jgi:hypothetical protein
MKKKQGKKTSNLTFYRIFDKMMLEKVCDEIMERSIYKELKNWKTQSSRLPLIVKSPA